MFSGHLHPWKPVVNSWWLNSNKGTKTLTGLSQKHLNKPSDLFVVVELRRWDARLPGRTASAVWIVDGAWKTGIGSNFTAIVILT